MISTSDIIKHTPGPWVWRGKSGTLHRIGDAPYTYGDLVLAPDYEYDSGTDTKVSDADAALIAAAPDLLVTLQTVRAHLIRLAWEENSIMIEGIDAALNKATGQS